MLLTLEELYLLSVSILSKNIYSLSEKIVKILFPVFYLWEAEFFSYT